jgi:hypothetical protein
MQKLFYLSMACSVLFLLSGVAIGQQVQSSDPTTAADEIMALKSTDGRSHQIQAIAIGQSDNKEVVYLVEGVIDPPPQGTMAFIDGDYFLWKLDTNGQLLRKELICKMTNGGNPFITLTSLPAPQGEAIVIGQFKERFGQTFYRIDADGKNVKSSRLKCSPFQGATLLADGKGLLLAGSVTGRNGIKGTLWKVDLDGKIEWKKGYDYKAKTEDQKEKVDNPEAKDSVKSSTKFYSAVLTDGTGGFIAVGDHGPINKFGAGERQIWLVRCDAAGNILSETKFPGRFPSISAIGNGQFAVLYDTSPTIFEIKSRVRVVDLELKQLWEKELSYNSLSVDKPAISSIPSGSGFVIAGCNRIADVEKKSVRVECDFFQYDTNGQVVSSAVIPITHESFMQTRIACTANNAYIAIRTKGLTPFNVNESAVYKIPLRKKDK